MQPHRHHILNTPVDAVDMTAALEFVDHQVRTGSAPGYVLAVNPEKVYVLRENAFLKDFFEKAALLLPDGIGMVKALRFLHGVRVTRVPGADLMQTICAHSPEKGYRIFIYGAKEDVNAGAVEELRRRYPGIKIVGRANGYVPQDKMPELVTRINQSDADILFVALGSPRQEQWLHDYSSQLTTVKVCQGIGGTLDTITGHVKRAPALFQRLNLEWLYRLIQQPTRIRRQAVLAKFFVEVCVARCQRGKKAHRHSL